MTHGRPLPPNILAVLIGASEFPIFKTLEPSSAFAASANAFQTYLRSVLALSNDNILFLFDSPLQPGEQLASIRTFLRNKMASTDTISDVIFYYCGHGHYLSEDDYVLALKCTDIDSKEATVFKISYLVEIVADLTRDKRNLVLLDACYSGAAIGRFLHMSLDGAADLVNQQFVSSNAISEESEIDGPDDRGGAVLFCAAGPKKWAKTPLEGQYTMFSGALKAVLDEGDPKSGPSLTLKRVAELVDWKIKRTFRLEAVKPQIHVPVQGGGDLLESPFFPNPAFSDLHETIRLSDTGVKDTSIPAVSPRLQTPGSPSNTVHTDNTEDAEGATAARAKSHDLFKYYPGAGTTYSNQATFTTHKASPERGLGAIRRPVLYFLLGIFTLFILTFLLNNIWLGPQEERHLGTLRGWSTFMELRKKIAGEKTISCGAGIGNPANGGLMIEYNITSGYRMSIDIRNELNNDDSNSYVVTYLNGKTKSSIDAPSRSAGTSIIFDPSPQLSVNIDKMSGASTLSVNYKTDKGIATHDNIDISGFGPMSQWVKDKCLGNV